MFVANKKLLGFGYYREGVVEELRRRSVIEISKLHFMSTLERRESAGISFRLD